ESPLVEMPWVDHVSAAWEPEPLRFVGVRGMYLAYQFADRHESGGRATTSPIAELADRIARRP
ncbi:MAG: FAD-dependent oxidoreductase, partial [Mycobacterium sp.]